MALDTPRIEELATRLPAVLQMLYLLFSEGYSSAQPDRLIRRELCEEAVRLTLLLVEHPVGATPETDALLALMHLDAARFDARVDGGGGLIVLEEQDRARWDREPIEVGLAYLARAARADGLSRYHIEAAIALEHCLAATYAETRWSEIARLYELLERVAPSPLNRLNRAIALAEWRGPDAGLALLEADERPGWLADYYLWDATLGELYRRRGDRARCGSPDARARVGAYARRKDAAATALGGVRRARVTRATAVAAQHGRRLHVACRAKAGSSSARVAPYDKPRQN